MSRRNNRTLPWGDPNPIRGVKHAQQAVAIRQEFQNGTTLTGEQLVEAGKEVFPQSEMEGKYTPASWFARRINAASSIVLSKDNRYVFVMNQDGTYTMTPLLEAFAGVNMAEALVRKHASVMHYSDILCQGVPVLELSEAKREAILNKYRFNQDAVGMTVGQLLLQQVGPKQALSDAISA